MQSTGQQQQQYNLKYFKYLLENLRSLVKIEYDIRLHVLCNKRKVIDIALFIRKIDKSATQSSSFTKKITILYVIE
jgi:hypothetical protein